MARRRCGEAMFYITLIGGGIVLLLYYGVLSPLLRSWMTLDDSFYDEVGDPDKPDDS